VQTEYFTLDTRSVKKQLEITTVVQDTWTSYFIQAIRKVIMKATLDIVRTLGKGKHFNILEI
jgi:hypothetical protein